MTKRKQKHCESLGDTAGQRTILDGQRSHWEGKLSEIPDMFGKEPSESALKAVGVFRREEARNILELGGGQGRDALFLAGNGFSVSVIDYSDSGVRIILERAADQDLSALVTATVHDVRNPLPFPDGYFDGCFAHMLYCMALTPAEIESLVKEVRRVLRPGGIHIYTVRNTEDPHYGKGIHRGGDLYEMNGFIVHYFNREKIDRLAQGFEIIDIERCEESGLPRRLFRVTMRKVG